MAITSQTLCRIRADRGVSRAGATAERIGTDGSSLLRSARAGLAAKHHLWTRRRNLRHRDACRASGVGRGSYRTITLARHKEATASPKFASSKDEADFGHRIIDDTLW